MSFVAAGVLPSLPFVRSLAVGLQRPSHLIASQPTARQQLQTTSHTVSESTASFDRFYKRTPAV